MLRLLTAFFLTAGIAPAVHAACDQASLSTFVAAAQSLDKKAAGLGEPLLRCPTAVNERAVQWLAFYYYVSGDKAKSAGVDNRAASGSGSGREAILSQAKAGNYQTLLRQIDNAEIGFGDAADAQLVLGRALVRDLKFQRGREAYTAYLRLKPEDNNVEAEQLFSYIWEGDYPAAEARFAASTAFRLQPDFAAAVKRGQALTRQLSKQNPAAAGTAADQPATAVVYVPGTYAVDHTAYLLKSVYRRQTTQLGYHGPVSISAASHGIAVEGLEDYTSRATEATIGGTYEFGKALRTTAKAGYFSPGDEHFFGDAAIYGIYPADFTYGVGFYKTPLALILPLIQDEQDVMRQAGYAEFRWTDYVAWRSEFRQEPDAAPHEYHAVTGRYPLWRGGSPDDTVHVKVPVTLETHPKPSAYYNTYPKTTGVGLGVDYSRADTGGWTLKLSSVYRLAFHQLRGQNAGTKRVSTVAAEAKLAYQAHQDVILTVQASYERSQEEELVDTTDRLNALGVGVMILTN